MGGDAEENAFLMKEYLSETSPNRDNVILNSAAKI